MVFIAARGTGTTSSQKMVFSLLEPGIQKKIVSVGRLQKLIDKNGVDYFF
jgi:hypothetical protein